MLVYKDESPDASFSEIPGSDQWSPNTKNHVKQSKFWINEGMKEAQTHVTLPREWFNLMDTKEDEKMNELALELGRLVEEEATEETLKIYVGDIFPGKLIQEASKLFSGTLKPHSNFQQNQSTHDLVTTIKKEQLTDIKHQEEIQQKQVLETPSEQSQSLIDLLQKEKPDPSQQHHSVLISSQQHLQSVSEFTKQERIPEMNEIEQKMINEIKEKTQNNLTIIQLKNEPSQMNQNSFKKNKLNPCRKEFATDSNISYEGEPCLNVEKLERDGRCGNSHYSNYHDVQLINSNIFTDSELSFEETLFGNKKTNTFVRSSQRSNRTSNQRGQFKSLVW